MQQLYRTVADELAKLQPIADDLIARGHKATANAFNDIRTEFSEKQYDFVNGTLCNYKNAENAELRMMIAQIDERIRSLKNAKPAADWDANPRHELALRAEIGIKVRRIYNLADDINHMMPSKMGSIVVARDFDILEDFVEIMRMCAALTHEPRIKHFAELNAFMSRLLSLDTRMHELKRILREHQ